MARHVAVAWAESPEELYQRYTAERNLSRRQRLQALWLVRSGRRVAEASELAGVGQRSLERWLQWYRQGGLPAVLVRVPGHGARGAASRLTAAQQMQLLDEVRSRRFRTYDEARQWVEQTFGVGYSYQGMYSLLARLADPAVQEAWKRGA